MSEEDSETQIYSVEIILENLQIISYTINSQIYNILTTQKCFDAQARIINENTCPAEETYLGLIIETGTNQICCQTVVLEEETN